ncbi:MAG: transposase [Arachnia propionica]
MARGVRNRKLVRLPLPRRHLPRRPPTRPVISQATVIAVGVSVLGRREILGMPVRDSESTDFWTEFLRSLRQRCLNPTRVTRHL